MNDPKLSLLKNCRTLMMMMESSRKSTVIESLLNHLSLIAFVFTMTSLIESHFAFKNWHENQNKKIKQKESVASSGLCHLLICKFVCRAIYHKHLTRLTIALRPCNLEASALSTANQLFVRLTQEDETTRIFVEPSSLHSEISIIKQGNKTRC